MLPTSSSLASLFFSYHQAGVPVLLWPASSSPTTRLVSQFFFGQPLLLLPPGWCPIHCTVSCAFWCYPIRRMCPANRNLLSPAMSWSRLCLVRFSTSVLVTFILSCNSFIHSFDEACTASSTDIPAIFTNLTGSLSLSQFWRANKCN